MLKKSKFDNEVTAIMLVVVFLSVGIKLLLDKKLYCFNVFAHNGEMENIVSFSSDMINVPIALIYHCAGQRKLI